MIFRLKRGFLESSAPFFHLKNFLKNFSLLAILLFLVVFGLRSVLFRPGIIGHTWDWGIPNFSEQFQASSFANFFIWNDKIYGGIYYPFKLEFFYWLVLSLTKLNGETLSKLLPLLTLFLSGISFSFTAKKLFRLDFFWVLTGALLYMFSPFAYLRLIAGHLPILLGYSLLPLIFYFSYRLFESPDFKKLALTGFLLAFGLPHPLMLFIAAVFIFVIAWFFLLKDASLRKKRLAVFGGLLLAFFFFSSYWLLPTFFQLIKSGTGLSVRPWQTVSEEMSTRLPYFSSISQSLAELFTFSYSFGLNTEFVYPLADNIRPIFVLVSLLFFASSLAVLPLSLKRKENLRLILILTVLEIIGFTLITGDKTIFGYLFYAPLIRFAGPVFSIFSNPLRLLPMVILPFSFLTVLFFSSWEKRGGEIRKWLMRSMVLIGLLFLFYPWFWRDLTEPVVKFSEQPMSLKMTKINPEDKKVFDFFSGFKEDFRVAYLPPAFVSWPGETDLSYSWNTAFSPKPTFLEFSQAPLSAAVINDLYTKASPNLAKLLGLASIKFLIYPHYQSFESYQDFIYGTSNYKPIFDENLLRQIGLIKQKTPFSTVEIFKNKDFLPKIYSASQVTFLNNDRELLAKIINFSDYENENAIFSTDKIGEKFSPQKEDAVYLQPECIACEGPIKIEGEELFPNVRFLPTSPLYLFTYWRERELWNKMQNFPPLRVNTDLVFMSKRLMELKRLVELRQDSYSVAVKTTERYQNLLNDLKNQLDLLAERGETDNGLLMKISFFLTEHLKNFNYLSQKTGNGEIINLIREIVDKTEEITSLIEKQLWLTLKNSEKKYLLRVLWPGTYGLYADLNPAEIAKIEVDEKEIIVQPEKYGENLFFLGKVKLDKGEHKLKLNLKATPNLFSDFATSSAVTKTSATFSSSGAAYQLHSQRENVQAVSNLENLDDKSQYKISFRYRIIGAPLRLTLEQDNDEKFKGFRRHKIDRILAAPNENWQKFEAFFTPNFNTSQTRIVFSLNSDQTETDTYLLEDFRVEKVINPGLLLKKDPLASKRKQPQIEFVKVNPTKYRVQVRGAETPFFLVFSESYHRQWQAFYEGSSSAVSEKDHLLVNGFSNAWYLEKTGDYNLTLEFTPQRIYVWGLRLTLASVLLAGLFLMIKSLLERKNGKRN